MSDLSSEKPAESPCFLFGKKPGGRQGPQSKPRIRPFSQALHLHHQTNGRLLTACSGVRFPPREPDFWYPVQQHPSLDMVDAAVSLAPDLKVPPGNRLKPLKGDLEGFYSTRINDQWRVIFRWEEGDAHEVKIDDYHE